MKKPDELIPFDCSTMRTIAHTLGIDYFKALLSDKLKDKKLPDSFYRNHYNANKNIDLDYLCEYGYAIKREYLDQNYYHITESGIVKFRKQFGEQVVYKPAKERNVDYLRQKINDYCDFAGYRFCNDNFQHVMEYAPKYFINHEYVSHTTKDVLNRFKPQLKKLLKQQVC